MISYFRLAQGCTVSIIRSKDYNTDIKWHDGELPPGVTDVGARVVSFKDINTDGAGYWYRYEKISERALTPARLLLAH